MRTFKGQKYDRIRKNLSKKGELFVDPEFPPSIKSLFFSKTVGDIVWKRPTELCKVPKLIIEGTNCEELTEGEFGGKWFVCAASCLGNNPKLFQKVIPEATTQEYSTPNHVGMFRFHFWSYGEWVEIVVDDLLPTKNGKLLYCHSKTHNEFWSPLLQKAYAKLYGDYESLFSGHTVDALVDFTGGVAERIDLTQCDADEEDKALLHFHHLVDALGNHALINTQITQGEGGGGDAQSEHEASHYEDGLLRNSGYVIADVKTISRRTTGGKMAELQMIRLQNPWTSGEWTGAWSSQSSEMMNLSPQERNKMGLVFQTEGEFWMTFHDYLTLFTNTDICHIVDTSIFTLGKRWTPSQLKGKWVVNGASSLNDRAGGDHNNSTFLSNPQYLFDMSRHDVVMCSLEQHDRTLERRSQSTDQLKIGFVIMKVEENRKYRVRRKCEIVVVSEFSMTRSIFKHMSLEEGRYVVIPCTSDAGKQGEYLLRFYNMAGGAVKELTKEGPEKSSFSCAAQPTLAVQIAVKSGDQLGSVKSTLDAYCVIKCEGEKVKSQTVKNSSSPVWNIEALFYKKKPTDPLIIQVYSSHMLTASCIGEAVVRDFGDQEGVEMELSLFERKKKKDQADIQLPGKLSIVVRSSDDLTAF